MSNISKKVSKGILQTARNPKISAKAHAAFAKVDSTRAALASFIQANKKLLTDYAALSQNFSEAVEEAKAAYIAEHEAIGPEYKGFSATRKRKVDVEGLLKAYPDAGALVETKYTLTIPNFEAAVKQQILPEEAFEEFVQPGDLIISAPKAV